eukprot:symbB.v1.2.012818.t1/scaffold884.1/size313170/30
MTCVQAFLQRWACGKCCDRKSCRQPHAGSATVRRERQEKFRAMQSSGSLPAKSDDGVGDLTVNEVDATLGKAMAHSSELVQRSRQLQDHFKQAQRGMLEINRLCDQADMSILQGQTLLNRSAHRIHELKQALEKHQQVLGTAGDDKTPRRRS